MRVMIVDDSTFMRSIIGKTVRSCGWDVVGEASDGREVIATYANCRPDVVTMDLTMRIMGGIEAVRALLLEFPDAHVVMVSAIGQRSAIKEALQIGAKGYVVKPFKVDQLTQELSRVVRMRYGA